MAVRDVDPSLFKLKDETKGGIEAKILFTQNDSVLFNEI